MSITEDMYADYKKRQPSDDPLTAFMGIGCSYAGKWFGGYARSGDRNYCLNARNSLLAQVPLLRGVVFWPKLFHEHHPDGVLIYCDPPYAGTTQYGAFNGFDHDLFWGKVRRWFRGNNTVVVSEYNAPDDFQCVLEIPTKTDMRVAGEKEARVEKLFMYKGGLK